MHKHILIATDGSELADKAVTHGLELARAIGARVSAVVVTEQWSSIEMAHEAEAGAQHPVEVYNEMMAREARRVLDAVARRASEAGVPCEAIHVKDSRPAEAIVETAERQGCDLIVMASHGRRGFNKLLLGSQTAKVLALTSTPVLVYR